MVVGLELNGKKTKYVDVSQDEHAVQNHNIYIYTYTYIYVCVINPLKDGMLKVFGNNPNKSKIYS